MEVAANAAVLRDCPRDAMPHPPTDPSGSEPLQRQLLRDLDGVVWGFDIDAGAWTYVSDGSRRVLGYPPETWLDDAGFRADRLHPDDRDRIERRLAHVSAEGGSFDETYRLRAADGSWRWLRDIGHAIVDADGHVASLQGLMVETTPAETIDQPDDRFRSVVEHLNAIVYLEEMPSADHTGRMLYVSPQVLDLLGFTQEEWMGDPVAWSRQFHPDDRQRIQAIYERIEHTGEPFHAEYRMFARDGSIRWFRDEAIVVRDAGGTPVYWQGVMFDITEEHETRAQLDDSEERYRTLVEQIPVIVYREAVLGDDMQIVYINSQVEALLGITPAEWIADSSVWMRAMHPEDRERVEEENRRTEVTGEPFVAEYRMFARDGRIVWFRDEAVLQLDEHGQPAYWQGVMMDITARREAETGLAEAESRYRALVEQLPAIAYIDPVDRRGTAYISPQTEAILGYTPEEWYADPDLWQHIVHPEDRERPKAIGPDPSASTYRMIAKDGREVWIHDQSRPVYDDAGNLVYWQGLLLDVTDQRRTLELQRALDLERLEAERLRAEDEMKTTFLHAVSHDLRTPLAAILGLAVTLEREDLTLEPAESRDLAHRISQNARRLDRMVGDFLDFERLARGAAEPSFTTVDVGALIREIVADSELIAERRLNVEVAPISVQADAGMLERIVENLLGNTAKHTPATSTIWVCMTRRDDGIEIVVEDDGPGVPDEDKERIFEPFRQGSTAATGSGVGLALVARFAELHDGRAWVEDRPGGGASFHVTLAAEPQERRIDLTALEADQPTETGSAADSQA
jgi:PAS domain S-box-containing protein